MRCNNLRFALPFAFPLSSTTTMTTAEPSNNYIHPLAADKYRGAVVEVRACVAQATALLPSHSLFHSRTSNCLQHSVCLEASLSAVR
jgi:hypothetical protein